MNRVWVYGANADGHSDAPRDDSRVFWRWGYRVSGSTARYINDATTVAQAEALAKAKASAIQKELMALGAPADVAWWVQEGRTKKATTWEEPRVESLC